MFPSYNPNMRGGNDPRRSALQSLFGGGGGGTPAPAPGGGPAPAQGGGLGAGPGPIRPVAMHLAMAFKEFVKGGGNPADMESILQFKSMIEGLGEGVPEQPQEPQPPAMQGPPGFAAAPAISAQAARPLRGLPAR